MFRSLRFQLPAMFLAVWGVGYKVATERTTAPAA